MSRWESGADERLRAAAFTLFAEQGYAATTVPQIAARAGLTTRTFFRHFTDKREVIFGDDEIPALATRVLREMPASVDRMTAIRQGLNGLAETRFEPRREQMKALRAVVASDPGLRERELRKRAELRAAIQAGFVERGETALDSAVAAAIAVEVLHLAFDLWLEDDGAPDPVDLRACLDRAWASLADLVAVPVEQFPS